MTSDTRHRGPFELLRFTVAPVSADVGVVELEGRFVEQSRFTRHPVLVVEHGEGRRDELAPVRATRAGERWRAVYAVPVPALDGGVFALGLRGTLLDLPSPDLADDGDRLGVLAREVNALRRRLEAAEDAAAARRREADAAAGQLGAAVTAARDAALAESGDRIAALEQELVHAYRQAADDVAEARSEVAAAQEQAVAAAMSRAEDAEGRAMRAQRSAEEAERRGEEAERRAEEAERRREQAERRAEAAEARGNDAEQRARTAEDAAASAGAEVDVLRGELVEERERSQAVVGDLQARLAEARAAHGDDRTEVLERDEAADQRAEDAHGTTEVLPPVSDGPRTLENPPIAPAEEPVRAGSEHGPGRWVAVAALGLFLFVLLGLLFGFLG